MSSLLQHLEKVKGRRNEPREADKGVSSLRASRNSPNSHTSSQLTQHWLLHNNIPAKAAGAQGWQIRNLGDLILSISTVPQ